jgi:hypothetical protein
MEFEAIIVGSAVSNCRVNDVESPLILIPEVASMEKIGLLELTATGI